MGCCGTVPSTLCATLTAFTDGTPPGPPVPCGETLGLSVGFVVMLTGGIIGPGEWYYVGNNTTTALQDSGYGPAGTLINWNLQLGCGVSDVGWDLAIAVGGTPEAPACEGGANVVTYPACCDPIDLMFDADVTGCCGESGMVWEITEC